MLAGDGVADNYHFPTDILDKGETVAAIEQIAVAAAEASKVEALRRYAVRRVRHGAEHEPPIGAVEDAE
jgi:hypothetical protein